MPDPASRTAMPSSLGPPSVVQRAWPAVLVSVGGMLTALDLQIVNVALPQIGVEFSAGLAGLAWTVNAYTLAFASLLLTAGALSDRIGGWPIFTVGVITFSVASLACGLAAGIGSLVASRAVQGIGAALILATSFALLARAYQGHARVVAIATYVITSTTAANLGPLVGGALVDAFGWRSIFLINLPIGVLFLIGLAGMRFGSAEPTHSGQRLDLTGATLAALGLFALNYMLLTGAAYGWQRPDISAAAAAAVAALGAFLLVQWRKGPDAMFDLRLFTIPSFAGAIAMCFLIRVVSLGTLPFFVFWLQGALGYSALDTGLRLLTLSVPVLMVATLATRLQRHFSPRMLIAAGGLAATIGALLLLRIGPGEQWTVAIPGFVFLGVGIGLVFPPLIGVAVGVVTPQRAGMASGMTNTFFPIGTAIGVAGFGAASAATVDLAGLPGPVRDAVIAGRFDAVPPQFMDTALNAFTDGLLVIAGSMAVLSALSVLITLATIRERDHVHGS